jgi:hypothetical protein
MVNNKKRAFACYHIVNRDTSLWIYVTSFKNPSEIRVYRANGDEVIAMPVSQADPRSGESELVALQLHGWGMNGKGMKSRQPISAFFNDKIYNQSLISSTKSTSTRVSLMNRRSREQKIKITVHGSGIPNLLITKILHNISQKYPKRQTRFA